MKDEFGIGVFELVCEEVWNIKGKYDEYDYGVISEKIERQMSDDAYDLLRDRWDDIRDCRTRKQLRNYLRSLFFTLKATK